MPPRGAVQSVREGSDAQRQGVLPNDVIVAVNGETITDMDQLQAIKEGLAWGTAHFRSGAAATTWSGTWPWWTSTRWRSS